MSQSTITTHRWASHGRGPSTEAAIVKALRNTDDLSTLKNLSVRIKGATRTFHQLVRHPVTKAVVTEPYGWTVATADGALGTMLHEISFDA